jgi:uncharacterized protein YbbC (DUF1343 family)
MNTPREVLINETSNTGREYPRWLDLFFHKRCAINHSFFKLFAFLLIYAIGLSWGRAQTKFVNPVIIKNNYAPPGGYDTNIVVGAVRTEQYLPLLRNKKVAVVANQTSLINKTHLVDSLLQLKIDVKKVFTLEHGFRGTASAGETITSTRDEKTGLPLVSLYGKLKKPSAESLAGVDVILFDIQDVGARFYTYISSLHYIMQAAAENNKEVIVLDRPNPNGFYVDGPVLQMKYKSFIGMHPVPVVHGMTIGEYAQMINGEKWLENSLVCNLKIVTCENYTHKSLYKLPVPPSPNLQTMESVYAYPSLCLLESTMASVGRGTSFPFMFYGMPEFKNGDTVLTPLSSAVAKNPPFVNQKCKGFRLKITEIDSLVLAPGLNLKWLLNGYNNSPDKKTFIPYKGSFYFICGNAKIRDMMVSGKSASAISQSWQNEVNKFKTVRKKYLLYPDFE